MYVCVYIYIEYTCISMIRTSTNKEFFWLGTLLDLCVRNNIGSY